ncbi:hypothetical protein BH09PAT2_BH09PAT2_03020 [soil metagenome]
MVNKKKGTNMEDKSGVWRIVIIGISILLIGLLAEHIFFASLNKLSFDSNSTIQYNNGGTNVIVATQFTASKKGFAASAETNAYVEVGPYYPINTHYNAQIKLGYYGVYPLSTRKEQP